MKLLAIETSTPGASVALVEKRTTLAAASRIDRTGHASFLVPAIDFCFHQVGWSPQDLDGVVIDVGPGLYTGIRVGLATAQGLAAAFGIPLIPVSSVDAIALEANYVHRTPHARYTESFAGLELYRSDNVDHRAVCFPSPLRFYLQRVEELREVVEKSFLAVAGQAQQPAQKSRHRDFLRHGLSQTHSFQAIPAAPAK